MKRYIALFFIIFCSGYFNDALASVSADSVGTKVQNGQKYIVHQVEAGETLFALSRKYGVSVQDIKDANTNQVTSLSVGQIINIPLVEVSINKNAKYHVVKPSETLYSVSRQYDVTVDELVGWNDLEGNSISIGQRLQVSAGEVGTNSAGANQGDRESISKEKKHTVTQSQTLYGISRMYGVTTDQIRSWNSLNSDDLYIGQVLIIAESSDNMPSSTQTNSSMLPTAEDDTKQKDKTETKQIPAKVETASETAAVGPAVVENDDTDEPSEKITQKGFAEVIEDSNNTKKYLALHRTAPQGTIMQVRNEMNNQSVFVRIVGPIPPTGDNSKVILKISKKAYDRLGAVDARFPVELSYMP